MRSGVIAECGSGPTEPALAMRQSFLDGERVEGVCDGIGTTWFLMRYNYRRREEAPYRINICMTWQPYIKASWQLVMDSEGRTRINLRTELEAYLVHMMARTMINTSIPPDIICLEFLRAKTKEDFRDIGDSCLFIDAWDVKRSKIVEPDYYQKMGRIAYGYASIKSRPADELFEVVSENFNFLSKVLRNIKQ